MAEKVRRDVEVVYSARDVSGPATQSAERNIDRIKRRQQELERSRGRSALNAAGGVGEGGYGPTAMRARFAERSAAEQEARDLQAGRLRAMRAMQRREAIESMAGPSFRDLGAARGAGGRAAVGASGGQDLHAQLRTIGFFAAATAVARALGNLPRTMDEYRAAVAGGESRTRAFLDALGKTIPVIGSFIEAGKGIRQFLDDEVFNTRGAARERREASAQTFREELGRKQEDRGRQTRQFVGELNELTGGFREEGRIRSQRTAQGRDSERVYQQQIKDLQALADKEREIRQNGLLGEQDAQRQYALIAEARAAVNQRTFEQMEEIAKRYNQQYRQEEQAHNDRLRELAEQAEVDELRSAGRHADAAMAELRQRNERELEEIRRHAQARAEADPDNAEGYRDMEQQQLAAAREAQARRARASASGNMTQAIIEAAREQARGMSGFTPGRQVQADSRLLTGAGSGPIVRQTKILETIEKHEAQIRQTMDALLTLTGQLPARIAAAVIPPAATPPTT